MKSIIRIMIVLIVLAVDQSNYGQKPIREVKDNAINSKSLPKITIVVDQTFEYIGRFEFKIRQIAAGERFVFVESKGKKVERMFIAQFEGFLPEVNDFYRYSFADSTIFGGHKFRQNTFAYSNSAAKQENPEGESALTFDFLTEKGFQMEDEMMLSRYLTVPDDEKKHEMILFYFENISRTNHSLAEFYEDDVDTPLWKDISKGLTARSLASFEIK